MKRVFITGAAGFIGSNLTDQLLADGLEVVGYDNLTTGRRWFLEGAEAHPAFKLVVGDALDLPALTAAMAGCDTVVHLCANADVRFGLEHPRRDLEQNTLVTFNVLEAMRTNGIRTIALSSTGSVYGEAKVIPTPEDAPFPVQTSLYGASKLACEGLLAAYAEGFQFEAYIFRFVSILGERYTHGHVFDFCRKLLVDPTRLPVLGDGQQKKSYLYVGDCVEAILHVLRLKTALTAPHRTAIYNLGTDEYCQVTDSIGWICRQMGVTPALEFSGGSRGWVGDNPFIFLETKRIRATGWAPKKSIAEGVAATAAWLLAHRRAFEG